MWLSNKLARWTTVAFLVASLLAHASALYGIRWLFWEA
jgi:hypothetical protein